MIRCMSLFDSPHEIIFSPGSYKTMRCMNILYMGIALVRGRIIEQMEQQMEDLRHQIFKR